jgi:hypothetical protein
MFNGAEETILQGSHMFATNKHRWVKFVEAFINLEAAGSGGRELMFQATNNDMAKAWARVVPYPHGSILAQEVFQSGIIPSDTDFRMYVAEMNIPGMDWANVDNGQNYHTSLDNPDNIQPGAMQRYGENVLETTRALLADEAFWTKLAKAHSSTVELEDDMVVDADSHEFLVFFDVLGWFVVVVPPWVSQVLVLFGVFVLAVFFRSVFGSIAVGEEDDVERGVRWQVFTKVSQLFARCLSYPFFSALITHWICGLCYYASNWLIIPLFFAPSLYGVSTCMTIVEVIDGKDMERKRPSPFRRELLSFSLGVAYWALLTLILLWKGKGSAYVAYSWCVIPAFVRLVHTIGIRELFTVRQVDWKNRQMKLETKSSAWFGAIVGSIVPLFLTIPLLLLVLRFFIPITGRSGHRVPGDVIVGLVCGVCTFFILLIPSSLLHLFPVRSVPMLKRGLLYFWGFGLITLIGMVMVYGRGQASFSDKFPKRIYAVHVDSVSRKNELKEESYLWIIDADSSSSVSVMSDVAARDSFFAVSDFETLDCEDNSKVYCDMPWYLPMKSEIPQSVKYTVKDRPLDATKANTCDLKLVSQHDPSPAGLNFRRLHFCLDSNERANLFFKDPESGGPVAWSFEAPLAPTGGHLYVLIANGVIPKKGTCFWVDAPKDAKLEVAWACHYMDEAKPKELVKFLAALPDWTSPVSFVSRWRDAQF